MKTTNLLKTPLALLLCLALLLSPAAASASGDGGSAVFVMDEFGFSLAFPESWTVLTRDVPEDDPRLALLGLPKAEMLRYFESAGIYADALDGDFGSETVVTVFDSPLDDYAAMSDASLLLLPALLGEGLAAAGVEVTDSSVLETDVTKFLRFDFSRVQDGMTVYGIMLNTVFDGHGVNITMTGYAGALSPEREAALLEIAGSFALPGREAAPSGDGSERFVYRDDAAGFEFTVPAGWVQADFSTEREHLTAKFVSLDQRGLSILYAGYDLWSSLSELDRIGKTRASFDTAALTAEDWAALAAQMGGTDVREEAFGENTFVVWHVTASPSALGDGFSLGISVYACIRNGCMAVFQLPDDPHGSVLDDYAALLESVR